MRWGAAPPPLPAQVLLRAPPELLEAACEALTSGGPDQLRVGLERGITSVAHWLGEGDYISLRAGLERATRSAAYWAGEGDRISCVMGRTALLEAAW